MHFRSCNDFSFTAYSSVVVVYQRKLASINQPHDGNEQPRAVGGATISPVSGWPASRRGLLSYALGFVPFVSIIPQALFPIALLLKLGVKERKKN